MKENSNQHLCNYFLNFCLFPCHFLSSLQVDVVLEEDKGFWAAIQNFMQSTKRPIILTASSADVAEQFGNCCEHLSFRLPSTVSRAVSFLKLMSSNMLFKSRNEFSH